MKKKICILYTGGTIGMVATENGYAPKENYLSELLSEITELKNPAMPSWDVIEFSPLLDSSNMTVRQWSVIGEEIALHYDDYDGFVILHATDTMCYAGKLKQACHPDRLSDTPVRNTQRRKRQYHSFLAYCS